VSERLSGEADDWYQVLSELEDRNVALERVGQLVERNSDELAGVREALSSRPTGAQIEYRRRRAVAGLILYGLAVIFLHDQHIEQCSPGARIQQAVHPEQVGGPSPVCDVVFPLHPHQDRPAGWQLLGLGLHAVGGAALVIWAQRPRRRAMTGEEPR
jgi:hypothetical protein